MASPIITIVSPDNLSNSTTPTVHFDALYQDTVDKLSASVKFEIDTVDTFDSGNLKALTYLAVATGTTTRMISTLANGTWYWRVTATNTSGTIVSTVYSLTVSQIIKRVLYQFENIAKYGPDWTKKRMLYQFENIAKYGPDWTKKRALYQYENITEAPPFPWIEKLSSLGVYPGEAITIYGSGFGYGIEDDTINIDRFLRQYGGIVYIGDQQAGIVSWGWNEITILIPGTMNPGKKTLKVSLAKPDSSGIRESSTFLIDVMGNSVLTDYYMELKVFARNNPKAPLSVIENANSRSIQKQLNSPGSGTLSLSRDDPKLVDLAMGNIVKAYLNQTELFAWVIETISPAYVNSNMQEVVPFSGRGVLALLEEAIVYPEGYPNQVTLERTWNEVFGAVIVLQLLQEAQSRGTLTDISVDFTATIDSEGLPWENTISLTLHTGEGLLSVVNKLTELKEFDIDMGSNLVLSAYKVKTGNKGVVLEPVTGVTEHTRSIKSNDIRTTLLCEGSNSAISVIEDTMAINEYGRKEGYLMARDLEAAHLADYGGKVLNLHTFLDWSDQISVDVFPFCPFVDYVVGDYVTLREMGQYGVIGINAIGEINSIVRVIAITLGVDENGILKAELDLNTFKEEYDVKIQKWLDSLSKNSVDKILSGDSSEPKAPADHNHDTLYAGINHNHNLIYSVLGHDHNDLYSPLDHTHDYSSVYLKKLQGTTLPIASVEYRGQLYTFLGAMGVEDKVYICMKLSDESYSWQLK